MTNRSAISNSTIIEFYIKSLHKKKKKTFIIEVKKCPGLNDQFYSQRIYFDLII